MWFYYEINEQIRWKLIIIFYLWVKVQNLMFSCISNNIFQLTWVSDKPRSSANTTFFFLLTGLDGSFSSDELDDPMLPSESALMTRHGLLGLAGMTCRTSRVGEAEDLEALNRRTDNGDCCFWFITNRKFW